MKIIFLMLTFSTLTHAVDRNRVCVGSRVVSCHTNGAQICADVTLIDAHTYRLSHLQEDIGCLSWGVSAKRSKQRLCQRLLKKFGEERSVKFIKGSAIQGPWGTAWDKPSVGTLDCQIKD